MKICGGWALLGRLGSVWVLWGRLGSAGSFRETPPVRTFNFDGGRHLEQQKQQICVRRESGMCRICWYAGALTDFATSGMSGIALNQVSAAKCCGYGVDGAQATGPYDCIMIPGAQKADGNFYGKMDFQPQSF